MNSKNLNEIIFTPHTNLDINASGGLHKYAANIAPHLKYLSDVNNTLFSFGSKNSLSEYLPGYKKRFFYWDVYSDSLQNYCAYLKSSLIYSGLFVIPDVQDLDLPNNFDEEILELRKKNWEIIKNLEKFRIIAMSNFTKNRLISNLQIPEKRIIVIGAGVDSLPYSINDVRSDLQNIVRSRKYLLIMSKYWKHKNIQNFADLNLDEVCERNNLYIIRIGGRTDNDSIKLSSRRVFDLGFRNNSEVNFLLKNAGALIHPSNYEGFGMPIGESLYEGVPVSAFNIPSIKELVGSKYPLVELENYSFLIENAVKLATQIDYRSKVMLEVNKDLKRMTWVNISKQIYMELIKD